MSLMLLTVHHLTHSPSYPIDTVKFIQLTQLKSIRLTHSQICLTDIQSNPPV